ncbi:RNA-binding cell elongation regulator Jag/EloR [Lachnospiraceae bacterium LCP25S3_G4]
MNEITVTAKTLDDAITEASIQLGIISNELEYDIIEKGSSGFLGIGSKKAIIKARHKRETAVEDVKVEAPIKEVIKNEVKKDIKKETKKEIKNDIKKEIKNDINQTTVSHPKKEETILVEVTPEAIKETEEFLVNVMKTMGMDVNVTSTVDKDGALSIDLEGDNMGILIGKRGQTLDSLQYLANRVANKVQDGYVRVKLDTENYRARRKATLENLAKNIAYKVKRTKKPVSLEPMNPYERRIIHSVLQSDTYVSTHSEGEEPYRRVVVTLSKRN